jgi:hypothetical protein
MHAPLPAISATISFVVALVAPPLAAFASTAISLCLLVLGAFVCRLLEDDAPPAAGDSR